MFEYWTHLACNFTGSKFIRKLLGILGTDYEVDIFQSTVFNLFFSRAHSIISLWTSHKTKTICYFWEPHFFWKKKSILWNI